MSTPGSARRRLASPSRGKTPVSPKAGGPTGSPSAGNIPQSKSKVSFNPVNQVDQDADGALSPRVTFQVQDENGQSVTDGVVSLSALEQLNFSPWTRCAHDDLSKGATNGSVFEVLVLSRIPGLQERIQEEYKFRDYNLVSARDKNLLLTGIVRRSANNELLDDEEDDNESFNITMAEGKDKKKKERRVSLMQRTASNKKQPPLSARRKSRAPAALVAANSRRSQMSLAELIAYHNNPDDVNTKEKEQKENDDQPAPARIMLPAQVAIDLPPKAETPDTPQRVFLSMCLPANLDDARDVAVCVTRAHIIIADPDLILPYIYETPCLRWLHSTWAGVEHIIAAIRSVKEHHEKKRAEYLALQAKAEADKKVIDEKEAVFLEKVNEHSPHLKEANLRMIEIQGGELDGIRAMKRPPDPVKLCLEAAVTFVGYQNIKSFDDILKIVTDINFKQSILAFDAFSMEESLQKSIVDKYFKNPDFTVEKMDRAFQLCGSIARWMQAQLKLAEAGEILKPMSAELTALKKAHKQLMSELREFDERLSKYDEEFRIEFSRTSGVFGPHVVEYCLGNIIARERNFNELVDMQRNHKWREGGTYRLLSNMTIGVMGVGEIGSHLCQVLKGFGTKVKAVVRHSRQQSELPVDELFSLEDDAEPDVKRKILGDFCAGCDYIINCLPSTPQTINLLGGDVLSTSNGAVFINVGRGDIIDDESLLRALDSNYLSGAILDVFTEEPLSSDSPFWDHPKIVVTPHMSGRSFASFVAELFSKNVTNFLNSTPLLQSVDVHRGY